MDVFNRGKCRVIVQLLHLWTLSSVLFFMAGILGTNSSRNSSKEVDHLCYHRQILSATVLISRTLFLACKHLYANVFRSVGVHQLVDSLFSYSVDIYNLENIMHYISQILYTTKTSNF